MKPAPFAYLEAQTLSEVCAHLAISEGDIKILAGGQSLVPLLSLRLATPLSVIDVRRIREMQILEVSASGIRLGAMVSQRSVEMNAGVSEKFPILKKAISHIGHPQIRNRGTIGGSLAHADPASELPALAVLANASFRVISVRGERVIAADEFFLGQYSTALADDEVLIEIEFPESALDRKYGFCEIARTRGAFAIAGAIVAVGENERPIDASVDVALFGVGSTPIHVSLTDHGVMELWGLNSFEAEVETLYQTLLDPSEDFQASREQRINYASHCTRKALDEIFG